jgi:hypothetical protein
MGGKEAGLKPMNVKHEGVSHWWVKGPSGEIWDITKAQFNTPVTYERSVSRGFLTREPSKRAKLLIKRIEDRFGL